MNRRLLVFLCVVFGLALLFCGLLMPVHLRAVDVRVIERAGRNTRTLSQIENLPSRQVATNSTAPESLPVTDFILRSENREAALAQLIGSANPGVQELLRCRALTNTVLFSPSSSASGQAFDAALCVCGLLLDDGKLTASLSNSIVSLATDANRGGSSEHLEQTLLDFMSLGQRFNRSQLAVFVNHIESAETLRFLTDEVRKESDQPTLFAAVVLSEQPDAVAHYLTRFNETGLKDLEASLRFGAGGVSELLRRDQRLHVSDFRNAIAVDFCLRKPEFALTVKWVLFLLSGFLLALALHFAWRPAADWEKPLEVRGIHLARETLFALGFLLVVLLVSEPFLAQDGQKGVLPFRLRLPGLGGPVSAENPANHGSFMNQISLLTMLLFFVLQALLYVASLVKLAEIRRQNVSARMKLKLLENEDHLFDAGLYLGFLGTIISLILVSLGVFKQPSLMAAYSSTSFGILFVVVFKVVNLRATRRKLLLDAENPPPPVETVQPAHTFAAPL